MPDLTNLTALSALVVLVLSLGVLLARGKLWTSGQVDRLDAYRKETIANKDATIDALRSQSLTDRETLGRMMTDLKTVLEQVLADRASAGRHSGPP
jgi:hypothetical protein